MSDAIAKKIKNNEQKLSVYMKKGDDSKANKTSDELKKLKQSHNELKLLLDKNLTAYQKILELNTKANI